MPINYNPAQYLNDFSWIGDIGKNLSQFAHELPELIELNKNIKENNKMKDMAWSGMQAYIDKMDGDLITNIASSMGLQYDNDSIEARKQLKEKLPKYTDTMSNEDYSKTLVNNFVVPFVSAAFSQGGGGSKTLGDLVAQIPGQLRTEFESTSLGREATEERQYQKQRERKIGVGGEGGEIREDYAVKKELEDVEGQELTQGVSSILDKVSSSQDVWRTEFEGVSPEAKEKAYSVLKDREQSDLRLQLKEMDKKLRGLTTGSNKPLAVDEFDSLANAINTRIDSVTSKLMNLEKLKDQGIYDKNKYKVEQRRLKSQLKELEIRQDIVEKSRLEFLKNKQYTVGGYNVATETAEREVRKEISEEEKAFIKEFNDKKFRGFNILDPKTWVGDKKAIEEFTTQYVEKFGKEPNINELKEAVPQFEELGGSTGSSGVTLKLGGGTTSGEEGSQNNPIVVNDQTDPKSVPVGSYFKYNGKLYLKESEGSVTLIGM